MKIKTTTELKSFANILALVLTSVAAFSLWRERPHWIWWFSVGGFFLLSGIFAPQALRPIDRWWTWLGEKIGTAVTYVLLTLTYFLMITPMGFLLKLLGKDLLLLRLEPKAESYWLPVEKDGPATRPFLPY